MYSSAYSYCDGDKGVNIPTGVIYCLDEGLILVGFFTYSGIGESIVAVGDYYELNGM